MKDADQGKESVKAQQSHHEAAVPGTEPGMCLSTAFTGKPFCYFCWVADFMYKPQRGHFLCAFFFPLKFCILLLINLIVTFHHRWDQPCLHLSDLHRCECRKFLWKEYSAKYYRRLLCLDWDVLISGLSPDVVFWKQRQSTRGRKPKEFVRSAEPGAWSAALVYSMLLLFITFRNVW